MRSVNNILVTGGAGFIGSAFIRYLLNFENFNGKIVNLDSLTYAANLNNLSEVASDPRYLFVKGNINNIDLVKHLLEIEKIDTILHFAAESHVDKSISNPLIFIEANVMGTASLLEAVRSFPKIHFHHVSTDEVYGSLGESGFFTEENKYQPNSPYSASKASSDHFVRAYANTYNLSFTMSNCSNNYGPYQNTEKFIPLMISNILNELPLPVYGNGSNIRDWLYVNDHVAALWQIVNFGKNGETYNIGGNFESSNLEILKLLMQIIAPKINKSIEDLEKLITFVTDRPGHDYRYAIDASKLKYHIGFQPLVSLKEGLNLTVDWYIQNIK